MVRGSVVNEDVLLSRVGRDREDDEKNSMVEMR